MVVDNPCHATAPVGDVLEYLLGEALDEPDFDTRDALARFERSTGLLVPPEIRPADPLVEPWPLRARADTHNPGGSEGMEGAPHVLVFDGPDEPRLARFVTHLGEDVTLAAEMDEDQDPRGTVREALTLLVQVVLVDHDGDCLDDDDARDALTSELVERLTPLFD